MIVLEILGILMIIIGGCSTVAKGLEMLAKYTKTPKDDEIMAKVVSVLAIIERILGAIALNPKKTD